MKKLSLILLATISLNSCTLPWMYCHLKLDGFKSTYTFPFSKNVLKEQIIDTYTYKKSLLTKNLGINLIENKAVEVHLNKSNWEEFKSNSTILMKDTLNIQIEKWHSRKTIGFKAIVSGNDSISSLTIQDVYFDRKNSCKKSQDFFKKKLKNKIEKKLINRLR